MENTAQEVRTDEKYYALKEAAKECGVSIETLRRACADGHLKGSQVPYRGGWSWRITEKAMFDWLEHRGEFRKPREKRSKKTKEFVAKKYSEMDISEFAGEFMNRIQEAYNAGLAEGERIGIEEGKKIAKAKMAKCCNEL